ncbi:hypothetical protein SLS56_008793 [Neofusicoccum ribis]|uniref:Transcriptional regulatory protein n=1 Tax=Neofusicoccum ribis TaxID=45134 RepID=A0ABR3SKM5_9PEZI
MTTRAAGKAASAVGTDSTGTSDASGSRRSSLNDSHNQADDAEIDRDQHAPSSTQSSESAEAEDERQQRRDADRDTMDVDVPGAPDSDTSSQDHDQESLDTSKNGNKRKHATSTPPSAGLPDRDHLSDDQQGSERPTKQPKRLPGRRRAPNADPSVEADLRRQLQLKTAYRAVVKVLKPVLAELADRAINDVEEDPKAHEQSDQYEVVKAALDARLAERIAYLDRKLAISKEHVERRKTAELEIVNTAYESVFSNVREDYLIRCQYQLLTILREAEKQTQDGYATDDEDGLVPRRRGMQYKWKPQGFLDPKSDSRSRFFLETDKLWKDHLLRETSKKERGEYLDKNSEEFDKTAVNSRENFATYDADRREYAMAVYNANSLAKAAEAVENGTAPPVVKTLPNEDATGLQLLRSSEGNFDA